MVEGNLIFALRAEGASGLVNGQSQRQTIDDNVQEGPNACSKKEDDEVKKGIEDLISTHGEGGKGGVAGKVPLVLLERK